MFKINQRQAQAAVELAVFGAILIFLLGTIIRSAVGNGMTQNDDLKSMRMAMLASWTGSQAFSDGVPLSTSRNSASILFIEDRLSPDVTKYGSIDRSAYIASGSGTFSYELLYPLAATEVGNNLPIMDVWVNGTQFPFTTAGFVQNYPVVRPASCGAPAGSCEQNRCLRNQREWVGGVVKASQFEGIVPIPLTAGETLADVQPQEQANAIAIFNELVSPEGAVTSVTGNGITQQGNISIFYAGLSQNFDTWFTGTPTSYTTEQVWSCPGSYYRSTNCGYSTIQIPVYNNPHFSGDMTGLSAQLNQIQTILINDRAQYKLFYTLVPNGGPSGTTGFSLTPPYEPSHPTQLNNELSSDLSLPFGCTSGNASCTTNGPTANNSNGGDLMYDLQRTGASNAAIETQFPSCNNISKCSEGGASSCLRCNIAWQWQAAAGIPGTKYDNWEGVQANTQGGQGPQNYDVNGSLKEQAIYAITATPSGTNGSITLVSYEDPEAGDIDVSWDSNSCSPKPGLQNQSEMFTFTQEGTHLLLKEGKAYNPETGQVVRSVNQKNNVDLIQREFQLSNDTGRFCDGVDETPPKCIGRCLKYGNDAYPNACSDSNGNVIPSLLTYSCTLQPGEITAPVPNPVEVCIPKLSNDNCFSSEQNIKSTCFDENNNMLYIRSRILDQSGRSWITNASGQLKVQ